MIYDLMCRQNEELSRFLSNCLNRGYYIEGELPKPDENYENNPLTRWHKPYPTRGSPKQKSTSISQKDCSNNRKKRLKRDVSIPCRVRSRSATKRSIEFIRHSSLFK